MSEPVHDGGCLCGAVRYRVRGRPTVSMVCHCRTCTRASGSAAVPWATFSSAVFALVAGVPVELRSSPPVVRTFCGVCGTPLTYRHAERIDELDVTTCSLDDPSVCPPTYHAWESHKVAWLVCPADVEKYDGDGPPH